MKALELPLSWELLELLLVQPQVWTQVLSGLLEVYWLLLEL